MVSTDDWRAEFRRNVNRMAGVQDETAKPQILKTYKIRSHSDRQKKYEVFYYSTGAWTCSCPAFIRGRSNAGKSIFERPHCKHIVDAQEIQQQEYERG